MERRTSLVAQLAGSHPVVADWSLTGVVTLAALGQRFGMPQDGSTGVRSTALGVAFALAGSVPIAWRRRFPLQVLAVTELAVLVELVLGLDRVGVVGSGRGCGGLCTVATSCPWRVSAPAAAAVVVLNTAVLLASQRRKVRQERGHADESIARSAPPGAAAQLLEGHTTRTLRTHGQPSMKRPGDPLSPP